MRSEVSVTPLATAEEEAQKILSVLSAGSNPGVDISGKSLLVEARLGEDFIVVALLKAGKSIEETDEVLFPLATLEHLLICVCMYVFVYIYICMLSVNLYMDIHVVGRRDGLR